ncbi:MAG: DUF2934 domain-containing protein [Gemmataceae bacterium]
MSRKHRQLNPVSAKTDDRSAPPKDQPTAPPPPARTTPSPQQEPTLDIIRRRAYQKWEEAGGPHGESDRFWLEAEREVYQQAGERGTAADRTET